MFAFSEWNMPAKVVGPDPVLAKLQSCFSYFVLDKLNQ